MTPQWLRDALLGLPEEAQLKAFGLLAESMKWRGRRSILSPPLPSTFEQYIISLGDLLHENGYSIEQYT